MVRQVASPIIVHIVHHDALDRITELQIAPPKNSLLTFSTFLYYT